MPSVLTEIGFMSNPTELKYITSEKGQKELTNAIFVAIQQYVANVNRSLLIDSATPAPVQEKPVQPTPAPLPKGKRYTIQLMASVNSISTSHNEFKSYKGKAWEYVGSGTLKYKYCVGDYATKSEAQEAIKEVRKEFPQAFILTFERSKTLKFTDYEERG